MEDVAKAAGVTRQTVYAHYPSREALLMAVMRRARDTVLAAMDAANPDEGPAPAALVRLLDAGWDAMEAYPFLWELSSQVVGPDQDVELHAGVLGRIERLIRRGQASSEFDPDVPTRWLLAAMMAVGRAAEDEVVAGRMTPDEATRTVHRSVLRIFGVEPSTPADASLGKVAVQPAFAQPGQVPSASSG
jgi:AcrR family transcriptional regulator